MIKVIMMMFSICGEPTYLSITNFETNLMYHGEWELSMEHPQAQKQMMRVVKDVDPEEIHQTNVELNKECIAV